MATPAASTLASTGQTLLASIQSNALAQGAALITTLTSLGGTLLGQTAQNFGVFVTNYSQYVQANPTQASVYTTAYNIYWPQFIAAETNSVDQDIAAAIGALSSSIDAVLTAIANGSANLASLL